MQETHNGIPQATGAHDTFWDWVSQNQESAHMIMWLMSDRALPRSFRMMEGFGVNTFRFINDQGKAHFVRFHWKPVLGTHSLAFDEAEILGGKDPDFNRRDLWESIEMGNYPDYELGMVNSSDNNQLEVQHTFTTDASVVFDAVYVDGGKNATPQFEREATHFIKEAFKHYKPIAGTNEGQLWLEIENIANSLGVFVDNGNPDWVNQFVQGVASHRFWKRVLV